MKHIFEILSIFMKYSSANGREYDVYSEKDRFFMEGPYPFHLLKEDAERLANLNCVFDEEDELWEVSLLK